MEVLENEVQYEITKKRLEFTEKTLNDFKANSNNLNEEDLELQLSILGSRIEEFKELIYLYENIKIASSNIFSLEDNQIFVFGSNLSGRHGLGAAKTAMKWGAKYGQAEGLQGQTYGIPTVNKLITKKLPLHEIETYVNNFIEFAKDNPDKDFLVTQIGCGLAGYYPTEIAPFFKKAVGVKNIHLPIDFIQVLYDKFNF
jgi:hypothetical protein